MPTLWLRGARRCKRSIQYCDKPAAKDSTRECFEDGGGKVPAVKEAEDAQAVAM
jgi:hypothetical protein